MRFLYQLAQVVTDDELPLPRPEVSSTNVANILQITFGVAGGIALVIITLAGLRFVVANGDPQSIAKAKNTIIYAALGLVVCISGFSIVTFVLGKV